MPKADTVQWADSPGSPYRATPADRLKNGLVPDQKARVLDVRLDQLLLDGSGLDVNLARSVTSANVRLTMEGASELTVEVEDPHGKLLRSDVLTSWAFGVTSDADNEAAWVRRSKPVDVTLDGLVFRLVRVDKEGTRLTLTFEERAVTYLRRHKGARSAPRSHITRGQFVQMLVREVKANGGIEWFIPERWEKQPIKRDREKKTAAEKRDTGSPGFADGVVLKIKGETATEHQLRNMETALDVADSLDAGKKATLAIMVGGIGESRFLTSAVGPVVPGQGQARGVWQLMPATEKALGYSYKDVAAGAHTFLKDGFYRYGGAIKLAKDNPHMSPGEIASRVEGSASNGENAAYYDGFLAEAEAAIRAYGGSASEQVATYRKQYRFKREKHESSWDCIGRLGDDVRFRRFMRLGRLWFVSEDWLFRQKPELTVEERKKGVDTIDYGLDLFARGKNPVAEVTVAARANRWTAVPGMVVLVKGQGPANGRYLVSEVERDLLDASGALTITLRKPIPKQAEPAAEKGQKAQDDAAGVDAVLAEAKRISGKKFPYVWGGGHVRAGKPDGGTGRDPGIGYDCSGYTAACLLAGDMLPSDWATGVPASGTFASSWGRPGTGKHMTVWANSEHVWIQFHDGAGKRADTSPWGSGSSGPRVRPMNRSTAGFTPRHWPGT